MSTVKAGSLYFALVFAAGWVLGLIREFLVVPLAGQITGLLLEAPIMLLVMITATRWIIQRFCVPSKLLPRLIIGLIGLGFLLISEVVGLWWVRRLSVEEYLAHLGSISGAVTLLLYALYAVMPLIVQRDQCEVESARPTKHIVH